MKNRRIVWQALVSVILTVTMVLPASAVEASVRMPPSDESCINHVVIDDWNDASRMYLNTPQGQVTPMVAAGYRYTVGLKSDGTAVAAGRNDDGQCDVAEWTDVVQVSAGTWHTVGLRSDGRVVAVGNNNHGQCEVTGWTDIVQVAAGATHTVGLKSDGSVVAVGYNYHGQCNVGDWRDITQVAAGGAHTVGLRSDGIVVAVGANCNGECDVGDWTGIEQVTAGGSHTVGLKSDGTVVAVGYNGQGQCDVGHWTDVVQVSAAGFGSVGLKSCGTAVAVGNNCHGQGNVGDWTDIVQVAAGASHTVGLKSDGSVVAVGRNDNGECNVEHWNLGETLPKTGLADSPWPKFGQNLQNTGRSPYIGPKIPELKWSFISGDEFGGAAPTIGTDGTVYVGSYVGNVYAINPDGTEKWRFTTGRNVKASPAIAADGTIYVGSADNNLYAMNPDGSLKWSFAAGHSVTWSSPAIGADGTIYVGSHDQNFYAINPDGTEKWTFTTDGYVISSPAVGVDGTIYVGSWDGNLYAINPDGTQKWRFTADGPVNSHPAVGVDGTIYVGSNDHNLYAINPDGTEKWRFVTEHWIYSSPAVGTDGTVYVGSYDRNLYAINPDGTEKWRFTTDHWVSSSPAIGADGVIYVGSGDNNLYAINPDGTEKWRFTTEHYVSASPAIGADGIIYVGSWDNKFYAIGEGVGAPVSIAISPKESTIVAGESQAYTIMATDEFGNTFDVTAETEFTIDEKAGGEWVDNTYTSEFLGEWTVTGTYEGLTDTATLTVTEPDMPKFLTLPFNDPNIKVQQGWRFTAPIGPNPDDPYAHNGIDYIRGVLDNPATWQAFDVVAAADGVAMHSSGGGYGDFVLIRHEETDTEGRNYFTLYAHLGAIEDSITHREDRFSSDYENWTPITRGQKIGVSGATGVVDPTWVHLHFEVQRGAYAQNKVDPYDICNERSAYPAGDNYDGLGPQVLWMTDPPTPHEATHQVFLTQPLAIGSLSDHPLIYIAGTEVVGVFEVTNRSDSPVSIDALGIMGTSLEGHPVDFPTVTNIALGVGESFFYQQEIALPADPGLYRFVAARYVAGTGWEQIDVELDGQLIEDPHEAGTIRSTVLRVIEETDLDVAPPAGDWEKIAGPWDDDPLRELIHLGADEESGLIYAVENLYKRRPPLTAPPSFAGAELWVKKGDAEWQRIGEGLPKIPFSDHRQRIYTLSLHPQNPDTVYVGHLRGLYKSEDGGSTFERVDELHIKTYWGLWTEYPKVHSIAIHPSNPDMIYVGGVMQGRTGVWVWGSEDGGESWELLDEGFSDRPGVLTVEQLALDTSSPHEVLYASGRREDYRRWQTDTYPVGIYRMATAIGLEWDRVEDRINEGIPLPVTPNLVTDIQVAAYGTVYFATNTNRVFVSSDKGETWHEVSGHEGRNPLPKSGSTVLAASDSPFTLVIHPRSQNIVYGGSLSAGVYLTVNGGEDWFSLGLHDKAVRHITTDLTENGLYAVTSYGLYRRGIASDHMIALRHHSPIEVRVYDSLGNVSGVVDGEAKQGIPNVGVFDDTIVISDPQESYRYQIVGTGEGEYGVTVIHTEEGDIGSFETYDIPISLGAIHQYSIDWDALAQGEDGVTVSVDSDGDGVFERTLTVGSTLAAVQTDTGTGTAYFTSSDGIMEDLEAQPRLPGIPAGYTFPHGLFSFKVTELDYDGQTVTVTIDLPTPVPAGTKWWKHHDGQWHDYDIPITIRGNTITITLTDGGIGDIDHAADGTITDPGGPGYPRPLPPTAGSAYPMWSVFLAAVMAGASLLLLRRLHRGQESA